jgi:hypothetical protein
LAVIYSLKINSKMATKKRSIKRKTTTHKRKVGAVRHRVAAPRRRSSSRSKVGAIGATGEILLGAVAGSLATRIISANMPAPKTPTSMDLRPYIGLVIGAGAEFFGKKNLLVRSMGIGAIVESSRAIIQDKYILSLTGAKTAGLPYTAGTMGRKQMKRLMGIRNGLAGNQRIIAGTSTPNGLAGVKVSNHQFYDGM